MRTQFATLKSILQVCEDSKSPFENKRSLKSLFKDLQTLLSVCTPHSPLQNPPPHCETLHHLATTNHSKRRPTPLTPFRTWHAVEEAIPTLHCLVSWGQEPPLLRIRHFRPSSPWPFHLLMVDCPLTLLNADTRCGDHWLLHPLSHPYVALHLRRLGLQALESYLGIHNLILGTLPILSFLPASHRKPSSRGLWSPRHPLRAIQIVEPDHSIPSFILTSRPYDIGWSYGIHLDYSRGIISSALWLLESSSTPEWQWTSISPWLLRAPKVLPPFTSAMMGARVSLRLDTL